MTSEATTVTLEEANDLGLAILLEEARAAGGEVKIVDDRGQLIALVVTLQTGDALNVLTSRQRKALEAIKEHQGGGILAIKWLRANYTEEYLGLKEAKELIDWALRHAIASATRL